MTATITELDDIIADALAVPCENQRRDNARPDSLRQIGCDGNPAEWVARTVECCPAGNFVELWCGACKDRLLKLPRVHCRTCGTEFAPAADAFRFEPLSGATT